MVFLVCLQDVECLVNLLRLALAEVNLSLVFVPNTPDLFPLLVTSIPTTKGSWTCTAVQVHIIRLNKSPAMYQKKMRTIKLGLHKGTTVTLPVEELIVFRFYILSYTLGVWGDCSCIKTSSWTDSQFAIKLIWC